MGVKAALRWLFGTNAEMLTEEAQHDAEVVVADILRNEPQPDRYSVALGKIEQLHASQRNLDKVLPARSLDEALHQMVGERRK